MLSVLLATHNGADTIERTLAAMSELDAPAGGWKLVVVNNASTDDSEALILKWRDRLPLEYLVEPRLGKSNAINTALDRAEGDFIIMTDDDVLPERNWLTEWRRMADSYPEISVFGGAIVPAFEVPPPSWLVDDGCFGPLYGRSPPVPEGRFDDDMLLHFNIPIAGANLAIRAAIRDRGWRFGANFMVGANGLMGEDSDFVRRIWSGGHQVGWAPNARIRHIIQKHQMTWAWIQRRVFRHGRFQFIQEEVSRDAATNRSVFRFPKWRIRKCGEILLHLGKALVKRDSTRVFQESQALVYHLGAISQAWTLVKQERSFPFLK